MSARQVITIRYSDRACIKLANLRAESFDKDVVLSERSRYRFDCYVFSDRARYTEGPYSIPGTLLSAYLLNSSRRTCLAYLPAKVFLVTLRSRQTCFATDHRLRCSTIQQMTLVASFVGYPKTSVGAFLKLQAAARFHG